MDQLRRIFGHDGVLRQVVRGKWPYAFLIFVVLLSWGLTVRGIHDDSPTEDEWAHLVRGISYFQTRDMRIHVQHPPLANALAGLPSAFDDNPDVTQMRTWQDSYSPGLEYITVDYEHAREQLIRGRYMASLFLVGLVVYVFHFCYSLFGWPTAAAAACLVAFNPTLMGQARYVVTDMPVATFTAIAVGELVRYLINPKRVVTLGLALAGLVLSKHSGIVVLGMTMGVGLVAAVLGRGFFSREPQLLRRLSRWFVHSAVAGVIVIAAINAIYKFDRTGWTVGDILAAPEPKHWVTQRYKGEMLEKRSFLPSLPQSLRIPLPYPYLFGLFAVQEQNRGGYPTYFMGTQSRDAHWAYFPVLLVTKSPPALLVLLGLAAAVFWRNRNRPSAAPDIGTQSASTAAAAPLQDSTNHADRKHVDTTDNADDDEDSDDDEDADDSDDTEDPDDDAEDDDDEPAAKNARRDEATTNPRRDEPRASDAEAPRLLSQEPSSPSLETSARQTFYADLSLATGAFLAVSVMFLVFVMRSNLNMGVRHAIPLVPLISVIAARGFARAGEVLKGEPLLWVRTIGLSGILSVLWSSPAYLNYYNVLALGRGDWINVVGDDWGQDRAAFVRFVRKNDLQPLYYHTQTPTRKLEVDYLDLKYKSLDCRTKPAPGAWVAIHSQYVHRFEATKNCASWMRDLTPTYKFQDNIWVYKIPDRK